MNLHEWSWRCGPCESLFEPPDQPERLRTLLELPRTALSERPKRTQKQAQSRLDGDEVAELVAAYKAGGKTKKLAGQFGIHRTTVTDILQREGIALRPPGIDPDDVPTAIRLYQKGWSLARLARKFDVSPSTVTNAFRRAGEPIRRPGRRLTSPSG